jgi:23S rRNA pseudouridine2605 synthase
MARKPESSPHEGERIAKVMARAGLCSRREAESWIIAGRVAVNRQTLTSPARNVSPNDEITVDGKPLPMRERTRLFRYHKPRGLLTTNRDPQGRPTLFDSLPPGLPRLVSVGRLDFNSEGLLLLTNDGGLKRALELPETGWLRRYRVRANGKVTQSDLDRLKQGVTVDGVSYGPIDATLDRQQGANVWLTMGMREGKNREVRNVLRSVDLHVNRLIRVSYGPFQLAELKPGAIEEVKMRTLRDQLGHRIAREAGVDFDAPLREDESVKAKRAKPARGKADRREVRRQPPGPRRRH